MSLAESARGPAGGIEARGFTARVEDDVTWLRGAVERVPDRTRVIGASAKALAKAIGGRCDVAIYVQSVTESGRLETLAFLREQAVSICAQTLRSVTSVADLDVSALAERFWAPVIELVPRDRCRHAS